MTKRAPATRNPLGVSRYTRSMRGTTRATLAAVCAAIAAAALAYACGGNIAASAGDDAGPALDAAPGGACRTSSDCADAQFCNEPGCDGGTCQLIPTGCPGYEQEVCGCNGVSYANECLAQRGDLSPITSVAYGGFCRSDAIVRCTSPSDCGSDQVCVRDPRLPCDGGADCVGFCASDSPLDPQFSDCSEPANCGGALSSGSLQTATCAASACDDGAWSCDYCVYTSVFRCDAGSDCPAGDVCTPGSACDESGDCSGYCVVP